MPKNKTLKQKQAKLGNDMKGFIVTSQYIYDGHNTPQTLSSLYAVCMAYASATYDRTTMLTHCKQLTAQKNIEEKLITAVTEVSLCFEIEFITLDQQYQKVQGLSSDVLIANRTVIFVKGLKDDYNNFDKFLDILGCLMNVNIHIIVNGVISKNLVNDHNSDTVSMASVFDSYHREDAIHLFVMKTYNDIDGLCFHAISNIDALMGNTFGYFNFCRFSDNICSF